MQKFAFFDIDGTIYDGYTVADFYYFLADNRLIKNYEYVYTVDRELDALIAQKKLDYNQVTARVLDLSAEILAGIPVSTVQRWQQDFIQKHKKFFPWVHPLFKLLKDNQYKIYLVTAAADPHAQAIMSQVQVDTCFHTRLQIKDRTYTGIVEHLLNHEEKAHLIATLIDHLPQTKTLGFGDSIGDVEMLLRMDHSFLYTPRSDELQKIARDHQWTIVDKDTIISAVTAVL